MNDTTLNPGLVNHHNQMFFYNNQPAYTYEPVSNIPTFVNNQVVPGPQSTIVYPSSYLSPISATHTTISKHIPVEGVGVSPFVLPYQYSHQITGYGVMNNHPTTHLQHHQSNTGSYPSYTYVNNFSQNGGYPPFSQLNNVYPYPPQSGQFGYNPPYNGFNYPYYPTVTGPGR